MLALLAALGTAQAQAPLAGPDLGTLNWSPLDTAVRAQIAAGELPGAVIVAGDAQRIWLRKAYGWRAKLPKPEPMTPETIFDLASLTKVLVTTTAVLQLAEQGQLDLNAPAARYWPAFGAHGKEQVTLTQLLSHSSGLRAGFNPRQRWKGEAAGLQRIIAERLVQPSGTQIVYSDLNFLVLGELVQRVSGQRLAAYAQTHIFGPLGMHDTRYGVPRAQLPRVAPTQEINGHYLRGEVHDATAWRFGGVSGQSGVFGSADDLARFAQALLNRGALGPARILQPQTVDALLLPHGPLHTTPWRGLGWQLQPPLLANRDALPPLGTLAHTGYTGTGLWLDFVQGRFVIILSNRVHPDGQGDARPLRRQVLALLSSAAPPLAWDKLTALEPRFAAYPSTPPPPAADEPPPAVATGIDVLRMQGYAPLVGKRIGLITNVSALDQRGWRTLDRLRWVPGVNLVKVFSPEHGLYGDQEGRIASDAEPLSGLPVISLYGQTQRPSAEMLQGLDALVFDMQDAGARFYTYISTMGLAMEAAAQAGLPFIVLDRPNPIGAERIGGPVLDDSARSFTGYARLPVLHGMTVGELAQLFRDDIKQRQGREVQLQVVPMQGYKRSLYFDQTGLDWTPPSPNLRTLNTALLYPGVAWVEGSNVSVGRGTEHPFEWLGAPWIQSAKLLQALRQHALPGLQFEAVDFTPQAGPYRGVLCHGVRIRVTQRAELDTALLGVSLVQTLYRLWPQSFDLQRTADIIGSADTMQALREGQAPRAIAQRWQANLLSFSQLRSAHLLY